MFTVILYLEITDSIDLKHDLSVPPLI